jgi:hypothetical protein
MACSTLENIALGCQNNVGGVYALYVTDQSNVTATTVNSATHTVTAITNIDAYNVIDFKRYAGKLEESTEINDLNGSQITTQTITLSLTRREGVKSRALQLLGEGSRYLNIIVLDGNGKYWYVPFAQLTTIAGGTGQVKTDGSKYELTFVAMNDNLAYEVDSAIVPALLV